MPRYLQAALISHRFTALLALLASVTASAALALDPDGKKAPPAAALTQYAAACDLKDANGCFNLAGLHLRGLGTPASDADALAAYDLACALSDSAACDRAQFMRACADTDKPNADACDFIDKIKTFPPAP